MKKTIFLLGMIILILLGQDVQAQESDRERTWVTLRSDHTLLTQPGDTITLSGDLSAENYLPPYTIPLMVEVQHPDGTYAYDDVLDTDYQGHYELPVVVEEPGYLRVTVEFGGNLIYQPSGSEIIIPIQQPIGMAIVVAGNGRSSDLFDTIEIVSDMSVATFRNRNMLDEPGDSDANRIYYLHPDGVARDGVDADSTVANLIWAIETWAAELIPTRDSDGILSSEVVLTTPLTVILIGSINEDPDPQHSEFVFDVSDASEMISAFELNILLDNLEDSIMQQFTDAEVAEPLYVPMNIIVEGPTSGDFVQPLSKTGRVVLTSTDSVDRVTREGGRSYLSADGSVAFLSMFLSRIASGQYIQPSFAHARYEILSNQALNLQNPQLEATGNGIANQIADEYATATMPLEYRPVGDARPRLQNAFGSITLRDIPVAHLWVYVDDAEDSLDAVYAVVIPPEDSFEETHVVNLTPHPTEPNRWEGEYAGFYGEGNYTATYLALDTAGNAAEPITKTIIVSDTAPPLDVINLRKTFEYGDRVDLKWYISESYDTQGYRIYVTPPNGDEFLWGDVGNVHEARLCTSFWTSVCAVVRAALTAAAVRS